MQVIVNEQNKAYILKQQVAEGYTLDDKTQVVKNGLVYNKADDAPIAANPTDINNWVPVGTDFSDDISDLDVRIDTLETFKTNVDNKLNIANDSGLTLNSSGGLSVKLAENTDTFLNGIELDQNGALKASVYNLHARQTTDAGFAAQYDFSRDGIVLTTINIPKDQFLKDAEFIASLSVDDATTYGLESGKPYLKFTWQLDTDISTEGDQKVTFIPVKDLVDTYTGDNMYITIDSTNTISLDLEAVARDVYDNLKLGATVLKVTELSNTINGTEDAQGLVANVASNTSAITKNAEDITALAATVTQNTTDISKNNTNIQGLASIVTTIRGLGIVNDVDETPSYGIKLTSADLENGAVVASISVDIDTLAAAVIAKHDVPDPIASNIAVSAFGTTYTEDTNVQAVLESLDSRIRAAVSGGVTSVVNGFGINVNATDANNPTVSVKTSDLVVSGSALTVNTDNKIDIVWSEL